MGEKIGDKEAIKVIVDSYLEEVSLLHELLFSNFSLDKCDAVSHVYDIVSLISIDLEEALNETTVTG